MSCGDIEIREVSIKRSAELMAHERAYLTLLAKLRDREALAYFLRRLQTDDDGWESVHDEIKAMYRVEADALLAYLLPEQP